MFQKLIITFLLVVILALSSQRLPFAVKSVYSSDEQLLAKEQMSLETRYPNESVNTV